MRRFLLAAALLVAGLSLHACDTLGASDAPRISVRLTDAPFPFDLADSANVTITRIELAASAEADSTDADSSGSDDRRSDRVVLYDGPPVALNLLDLRDGVDTLLVDRLAVPEGGTYRQLRIFVGDDASVVFTDGSTYDLKLPSAQQSGIKVMLPEYGGESDLDVLIDFNVEDSFVTRGNPEADNFQGFLFKPVLRLESFSEDDGDSDESEDSVD